jgi:anti-sigma B factor antagonist
MTPHPGRRGLAVEQAGEVTLVRFTLSEIMHVEVIESVGDQLGGLVEDEGRRQLLLDFSGVQKVSSALLGKLVALHKKLLPRDGRMALCGLESEVSRVLDLCQLRRLLHVYGSAAEALEAFRRGGAGLENDQASGVSGR